MLGAAAGPELCGAAGGRHSPRELLAPAAFQLCINSARLYLRKASLIRV